MAGDHFSIENDFDAIYKYFLLTDNYKHVLDIIELSFRYIERRVSNEDYQSGGNGIKRTPDEGISEPNDIDRMVISKEFLLYSYGIKCTPDAAISELNARFKEHGVGFQYESGELIRVDSEYIHCFNNFSARSAS